MRKLKRQDVSLPQGEQNESTLDDVVSPESTPQALDDGIDDIAGDLSGQAPSVNQGVINAELEKTAAGQNQSVPTDTPQTAKGREKVKFDPTVHEVDEFGRPVMTPQGRFKKKPGVGRKVNLPQGGMSGVPGAQGLTPEAMRQQNLAAAGTITVLKEQLSCVFIGDSMKLEKVERDAETAALAAALDYSFPAGVPVNPWLGYGFIVTAGYARRFNHPQTQSFMGKLKARAATWWLNRQLKGKRNATQSGSGGDNVGQNDAGHSPSQQS